MDEHDDQYCNTTLGLGLNPYEPKREDQKKVKPMLFLDLSISRHPDDLRIIDSSLSLNLFENYEKESENKEYDSNSYKNCSRKKMRLTRDQTTLLEDSFRQHSTLTTAQKQALAEKLNVKTRQVEVWFQNRRAWTKLKQTEADFQFLKKTWERLMEENCRLKKELIELRSYIKIETPPPPPPPCFFRLPYCEGPEA
ncbi:hypothetical protein ABFS82_11G023900 [Erythranthe guttata]|uniref:homeobox-leucine zipper protein HOX19-like n=1 Tax=Erythranthe guttata TaxID=4155 RepID=UPI00064D9D0B|nr:PREDICTED: homeobox-leucine zipper protein HOX19-like [Erythranthe guttata]|eukprot:XP_012857274.1 PREDICTED: homeobox-leucine zipper protein HOX19-like [Erythranthe guttata]